ncbi:MAG: phosphatase PAP2 family protein [Bdellovibrionales bacterium]
MNMKPLVRQILRHHDFLSIVLLLLVCASAWGFMEIADELAEGDLHELDWQLLMLLRSAENPADPIGPRWFEEMVRDATALGSTLILTLLVVSAAVALLMERKRQAAVWLIGSSLGALAFSTFFKNVFDRERPNVLAPELLPTSYSFPSGHSLLSAAVYFTAAALLVHVIPRKRTKAFLLTVALLLTLLTGFSRVYLGVHFPSDVLAGWTLGLGWSVLCWFVFWQVSNRLRRSEPPPDRF